MAVLCYNLLWRLLDLAYCKTVGPRIQKWRGKEVRAVTYVWLCSPVNTVPGYTQKAWRARASPIPLLLKSANPCNRLLSLVRPHDLLTELCIAHSTEFSD